MVKKVNPAQEVNARIKSFDGYFMRMKGNLPRTERFGIGSKIDFLLFELLELLRKTAYTPLTQKLGLLEDALNKTDSTRFFIQILWETKNLDNSKYIALSMPLDEIGRMLGGWNGQLTKQNSPKLRRRNKVSSGNRSGVVVVEVVVKPVVVPVPPVVVPV